jgi:golgi phosphoprotein 3
MTESSTPIPVDLPERLLLLATDDASGRVDTKSGALDLGLAGATLTELLLLERLATSGDHVTVANAAPTGDPILDEALAVIAVSKPRDSRHWVTKLAKTTIRERALDHLTEQGMLRREEHRILWVIPADRYPVENDASERDVRDAVRVTVIDGEEPTPRTAALIGILKACDLTGAVFSKDERKRHGDRIERIAEGEVLGGAVGKAVKELQDAITMVAVTAALSGAVAASS